MGYGQANQLLLFTSPNNLLSHNLCHVKPNRCEGEEDQREDFRVNFGQLN